MFNRLYIIYIIYICIYVHQILSSRFNSRVIIDSKKIFQIELNGFNGKGTIRSKIINFGDILT